MIRKVLYLEKLCLKMKYVWQAIYNSIFQIQKLHRLYKSNRRRIKQN